MKKLLLALFFVILLYSCDTGNSNVSEKNPFIGTWTFHDEDSVNNLTVWLTFYEDKTFNYISEYYYYTNDYSSEFSGTYFYDENEINFLYSYNSRNYDEFQRYKFYDTYLRLWSAGGYISGNNYSKSDTTIPKKNPTDDPLSGIDISWNIVTNSPFDDYTIDPLVFHNGMFIAAAYNYFNDDSHSKMAYSTDGIIWNLCQTDNDFLPVITDIAYGNGKYVASCSFGQNTTISQIGYSTDGIKWNFYDSTIFKTSSIGSITFGKGIFVAGDYDGKIAYSNDGINWNEIQNLPFGNSSIYHLEYGNNVFVLGTQDGKLGYSIDGISWNVVTDLIFGGGSIFDLKFVKDTFIASCSNEITYSKDGIYWEKRKEIKIFNKSGNSWDYIDAITYGENLFLLGTGAGNIAFSRDLISWKKVLDTKFLPYTQGRSDPINSIVYGNGKFVAAGYNGKITYSIK
jgi:hypothetical protein